MKPTDNKIIKLRNSDGSNSDDNTFVTLKEIFTNSDFGGVRDYFICDYQRPYV
jgi:hypothetical protein